MDILRSAVLLEEEKISFEQYRESDTYKYFELMSEALATMYSGTAYVLTPDVNAIPTDGIWYQTEKPTLTRPISGDLPEDHGKCMKVRSFLDDFYIIAYHKSALDYSHRAGRIESD